MKRRDSQWPGGLRWSLASLLVAGAVARGESPPPLADQLFDLGRQAVEQGAIAHAETFYRKVLTLAPGHTGACQALDSMLGLIVRLRQAESRQGPALACQVQVERALASVRVLATDEAGMVWRTAGKLSLALTDSTGNGRPVVEIADALALGVLDRLVRVELTQGRRVKGQATYKVRIDNRSPLILSGLALGGSAADPEAKAARLLGISLPPQKHLAIPVSGEVVKRLAPTLGVRILAVNLTEL